MAAAGVGACPCARARVGARVGDVSSIIITESLKSLAWVDGAAVVAAVGAAVVAATWSRVTCSTIA